MQSEYKELLIKYRDQNPHLDKTNLARKLIDEQKIDKAVRTIRGHLLELEEENASSEETTHSGKADLKYYSAGEEVLSLDEVLSVLKVDLKHYVVSKYWTRVVYGKSEADPDAEEIKGWRYSLELTNLLSIRDLRLQHKLKQEEEDIEKLARELLRGVPIRDTQSVFSYAPMLLAPVADLHTGSKTKKRSTHPEFGYDVLRKNLANAAHAINAQKKERVVVSLLGDMVETFSGLNHMNSWQEIEPGGFGANVVTITHQILSEFLDSISQIEKVILISGNHDRLSMSNKGWDQEGGVMQLLHYMLTLSHPGLVFEFDPTIESYYDEPSNINYLLSHGHRGLSKRPPADMILQFGKPEAYNVLIQGHLHKFDKRDWYAVDQVELQLRNYMAVTVPSIFPGNYYSHSNGWGSGSGITLFQESPYIKGVPKIEYIPLL